MLPPPDTLKSIARLADFVSDFGGPDLLGNVTRYCEACEGCRHCKSRNHRPYSELRPLPVPLRRREAIAMDITGPFPEHKTGVDGILTVVDRLTKFAMFLPCRYHAKAPELAEVLYAGWIPTKGYPKEIVCDRDTRFMSDFWLALIKRWGSSLKPRLATPKPMGLRRTLIRPDQKDWVERLPDAELAYNSSIHPAIGMSPFEFEHGSLVTSPLDTIIPRAAESDDHLLFLRRMQELLVKARDQMVKTQQRMSQQANHQRTTVEPLPSLDELRSHCKSQLAALRPDHKRSLNPTPYKVSVTDNLYSYIHFLWLSEAPVGELA
ncbi:hypothetical protein CBR_g54871 [Chara braunii]|uniref:Integrase catalytic domain-containing protein n=1 Tax=Chara braunii TaxID=69332 RepID=A0A388JPS5_CHABU|nr:hypothetical protein CBR_g54871 [Chara braunii]|eukprot:GBG59768.1 hypothetical protein CBR_g54871 [Chara braunii]